MIYDTLKLTQSWDLTVDGLGNIASATGSEAVAQDVASACRTVQGELFYDTSIGVPYPTLVWGKTFVPQLVRSLLEDAAKTVPGVVQAQATIALDSRSRILSGDVSVIDENGQALNATF